MGAPGGWGRRAEAGHCPRGVARAVSLLPQVMLVGDSGVGKTCLLVRFKDGAFLAGSFISTVGIDFRVRGRIQPPLPWAAWDPTWGPGWATPATRLPALTRTVADRCLCQGWQTLGARLCRGGGYWCSRVAQVPEASVAARLPTQVLQGWWLWGPPCTLAAPPPCACQSGCTCQGAGVLSTS